MSEYTLSRTGGVPLKFSGEQLAEVDGYRLRGREQTHWHELTLYRTAAGALVLAISYRTRWEGGIEADEAHILPAGEIQEFLRDYDPAKHLQMFPPGHEDRQARQVDDIRRRFAVQVTELLTAVADEVAEVLP
jgi:hypothetical protein